VTALMLSPLNKHSNQQSTFERNKKGLLAGTFLEVALGRSIMFLSAQQCPKLQQSWHIPKGCCAGGRAKEISQARPAKEISEAGQRDE